MTASYPDLRGRHILITGGANGIGEAVSEACVAQGAKVSIIDRDAAAGSELRDQLNAAGGRVHLATADLTDAGACEAAVDSAIAALGEVDVLINNAGFDPRHDITTMTSQQWDELFHLNVRHYFLTCRRVIPGMKARGKGSIIMTSSVQFFAGQDQLACYTATKGAVIGMVRSLAKEVGRHGIRVNAVAPGWVMTQRQLKERVTPEAQRKLLEELQCLPVLLQPRDLAPVYLFLASDASAAITRQTIVADAGWTMG